jgi:hypothetical protein
MHDLLGILPGYGGGGKRRQNDRLQLRPLQRLRHLFKGMPDKTREIDNDGNREEINDQQNNDQTPKGFVWSLGFIPLGFLGDNKW